MGVSGPSLVVPGFQVGIELLAAQSGQIGSADDLDRHRHLAARHEEDQVGQHPEHADQPGAPHVGPLAQGGHAERAAPQSPGADQDQVGLR